MIGAQLWLMMDELRHHSTPPILNNLKSVNYGFVFPDDWLRHGTYPSHCSGWVLSKGLGTNSELLLNWLFLKMTDERTKRCHAEY
jgi:hypothetical protein